MQEIHSENKLAQHTENKLAQHTENKLAQLLCDFCELQPATIQCYTCLMYWCSIECHYVVYDPRKVESRHQYCIKGDGDTPVYVNMLSYSSYRSYRFDHWILANGAKHKTSWMDIDKINQQSTVVLDSVPKLIPELVNIVNEYIAHKLTVNSLLDCLDCDQNWYVGQIVQIKDEIALIRFNGWTDKWNEWIPFKSTRLAPLHSYTKSDTNNIFAEKKDGCQ